MDSKRRAGLAILALSLLLAPIAAPLFAADAKAGEASAIERVARAAEKRFSGEWYGAIEDYLAAVALNPAYSDAYVGLAECYYELEEYDQALSYAKKAAPLRRGDPALADLEAFIRLGLGDLPGGRTLFAKVLAERPNDLDARFGLALLDLADGKKTEARLKLEDSLRLSPQNARALLSLALVSADQGKNEEARILSEKALRYHGEEPRVQYTAARLAAAEGDHDRAVFHARNALASSPGYADARRLLATLMYDSASYEEAIALMREAVARERKDPGSWFTLGLAQAGAGRTEEAIYSLRQATSLKPDDEIARIALENLIMDSSPIEDPAREPYADWHFSRGVEFQERSLFDQALFEYRRGLRIYPYSKKGRVYFAELLRQRGLPAKQLAELEFIREIGKADASVLDSIEIYDSLLGDSVSRNWNIDQYTLPKRPYRLAIFVLPGSGDGAHTAGEAVLLRYMKDILASSSRFSLISVAPLAATPAEAFQRARQAEADYFCIFRAQESERDLDLSAEFRVARTGSPAGSFHAYRSGNDRVKNSAIRLFGLIETSLEPKGSVLRRKQDQALVDLGAADGLKTGDRLLILKRGSLEVKPEGFGPSYAGKDLVGELVITRIDEEVCEGRLKSSGFFDTINTGDEVIKAPAGQTAAGTPAAPPTKTAAKPPAAPAAAEPEWPGLYAAVRRLR